jgi:prolyl-tRNA synthetase
MFMSGNDIASYVRSLETGDVKSMEIDFQALKSGPAASAVPSSTNKAVPDRKEDARRDGAVQIAIGVKKEVDFASWYTNVRCIST